MPAPLRHCAFGHCLAPLAERGRSLYCSPEHAEAARSRQTVEARAARITEAAYERISRGEAEPLPHLGWLTTTHGVVLDGAVVVELLALITAHRQAMSALVGLVRRPGVTPDALRHQVDDEVLRADRALLTSLTRVLTETQPRTQQSAPPPHR